MYNYMAAFYDEIFPMSKDQFNFVKSIVPPQGLLLDAGCATGELCIALAKQGIATVGLDLDKDMIDIARRRTQPQPQTQPYDLKQTRNHKQPQNRTQIKDPTDNTVPDNLAIPAIPAAFYHGAMEHIDRMFAPHSFDTIVCLGNTLVHGDGSEGIKAILEKMRKLLKKNGTIAVQILNYQSILSNKITELPAIETKHTYFERSYTHRKDGFLTFNTKLTIKKNNQTGTGSVKLYPLEQPTIEKHMQDSGFSELVFYGDYKKNPLTAESFPLIFTAAAGQK